MTCVVALTSQRYKCDEVLTPVTSLTRGPVIVFSCISGYVLYSVERNYIDLSMRGSLVDIRIVIVSCRLDYARLRNTHTHKTHKRTQYD